MKLVIASRNVHKIREIRSMLKGSLKCDLYSLIDFPDYHPPQETGKTFEENASLKATHAALALNSWVIADDSGIVVPSLENRPGVYSARYAGVNCSDKDNRKKLLQEMESFQNEDRDAFFECCIALASPEGLEKTVCGRCEGTITQEEHGGQGFGYDSIFKKHEYSKTFAELEEEVKNRISHRRKAIDKILITLETLPQQATFST